MDGIGQAFIEGWPTELDRNHMKTRMTQTRLKSGMHQFDCSNSESRRTINGTATHPNKSEKKKQFFQAIRRFCRRQISAEFVSIRNPSSATVKLVVAAVAKTFGIFYQKPKLLASSATVYYRTP